MGSTPAGITMTPQLHPFLLLLLLLSPTSTTPGGVTPLMQSVVQESLSVTDAGDCYGGEYGGCQPLGGRCATVFCCCSGQDSGCGLVTCPEGTVFSGEWELYCEECNMYNMPDAQPSCVDPPTIGC